MTLFFNKHWAIIEIFQALLIYKSCIHILLLLELWLKTGKGINAHGTQQVVLVIVHKYYTYLNNCKIHCPVSEVKYSVELVVSSYPASVLQNSDAGWNKILALSFVLTQWQFWDLQLFLIKKTLLVLQQWSSSFRYLTYGYLIIRLSNENVYPFTERFNWSSELRFFHNAFVCNK